VQDLLGSLAARVAGDWTMSELPTTDDINVYDTLDERAAVEHFLGKDQADAEVLFRENFLYYQEDLMWMGPRAFCYYLPAALAYVVRDASNVGSLELGFLLNVIEFQLQDNEEAIAPVFLALRDAIDVVLDSIERLDDDPVELDRWTALRLRVGGSG
jgi:hypothetical protein